MAEGLTDVVCAACGARTSVPLEGAGRFVVKCRACGKRGVVDVAPEARTRGRPAELKRVARFTASPVFERIYHRLEDVSSHVPANRWEIVGVYFGVTALAEAAVYVNPYYGFLLHAVVLFGLLIHAGALWNRSEPLSRLAVAISVLPVIRLVSLAIPLSQFSFLQWFLILGVVVSLATITALGVLGESARAMGLRASEPRHRALEIGVVALGVPLGLIEYHILAPSALVPNASLPALVGPALMMIVFGGVLEELIYRGLLLRTLLGPFGTAGAVAIPALANAILAIAYGSAAMVFVVLVAGLAFGLVARRTGSVVGVGLSHGVANTLLFVVLPVTGMPF
ncbi:MAG TPA: CPBP family glutamic-type intramembrane protease [Candidatus Thermoplasmatota archaeon]|nr:CPBP family glutamic-type intramembrane protease [Candidatus Thermoplasmatota archaeon]